MLKKIIIGLGLLALLLILVVFYQTNTRQDQAVDLDGIPIPPKIHAFVLARNKSLVEIYYQLLYSKTAAKSKRAIEKYLSKDYIEHQSSAQHSKAGLQVYVQQHLQTYPESKRGIHRSIAQGDLVFIHVEETLNKQKRSAHGELFRISGNQITEHWAVEQAIPEQSSDPYTPFSGVALDLTSQLAQYYRDQGIRNFLNIWRNGDMDALHDSYSDTYIEHDLQQNNGIDALKKRLMPLKIWRMLGLETQIEVKQVLVEGDYLILYHHAEFPPFYAKQHGFDIFRLQQQGDAIKQVEHWGLEAKR